MSRIQNNRPLARNPLYNMNEYIFSKKIRRAAFLVIALGAATAWTATAEAASSTPAYSGVADIKQGLIGHLQALDALDAEILALKSDDAAAFSRTQEKMDNLTADVSELAKALVQQVPGIVIPSSTFHYRWDKDLRFGMENNKDVRALQSALQKEGCLDGAITGNFFAKTRVAVICFQRKRGFSSIPASGYVGPYTRKILNDAYAGE